MSPEALHEIEAIKQLKYAYFRLLDTKQFGALGDLLTEDVSTSFEGGNHSHQGRVAVVAFLQESLGSPRIVHLHNGHHPEIVLTGDATATGTWYLQDRVIIPDIDLEIGGTALYSDEYAKSDGRWRIAQTGYERIFEEHRQQSTGKLLSFTSRFDSPPSPDKEP